MTLHISEQSDVDALQAALQAQLDDHEARIAALEGQSGSSPSSSTSSSQSGSPSSSGSSTPSSSESSTPSSSPSAAPSDNIETIRNAGHPCPPVEDWWINEPTPAQIKAAIVAPLPGAPRRMWIPRMMDATTVDQSIVDGGGGYGAFGGSPLYPQQSAFASHWKRSLGDDAAADALMQEAITNYFADPFQGTVYAGGATASLYCRIMCLDWINFGTDYEAAFAVALAELEEEIASNTGDGQRDWRYDGYWNATHAQYSGWCLRTLLALCAYNVNPGGASHQWADQQIDQIGSPVTTDEDTANWSPWFAANVEQLLSRRGGGTEYGNGSSQWTGFGSYEESFAVGVLTHMWAVDTLTGGALMSVRDNLYVRTRHLGLVAERDHDTDHSHAGKACLLVWAKWFAGVDAEAAGNYAWLAGLSGAASGWRSLQAAAGPMPAAVAPSGVLEDRLGSAWHYRSDAGDLANSVKVRHTCPDLDNFRFSPDTGAFDFRIGTTGLTDARVNRGQINGAQCNGFWFGEVQPADGVSSNHISDANGWGHGCSAMNHNLRHLYFDNSPMLDDPAYILGDATGPQDDGTGVYRWLTDITSRIGRHDGNQVTPGDGVTGPCSIDLAFDPSANRLTLVHELRVDTPYLGWHFAPTHVPVFATGLPNHIDEFTIDGVVKVRIESLDSIAWDRVEKTEHVAPTSGTFRLDYHNRSTPVRSIAYTPQQRIAAHRVQITAEPA